MKRILAIFISILLVITAFSVMASAATGNEVTYNILDIKDNIKINGRYIETSTGITSDWTASGIEFSANCEGDVSVTVNTNTLNGTECYYTVYVDGVRLDKRLRLTTGTQSVVVASDLLKGDHTFKLAKETEMTTAMAEFRAITLDGTFNEKPANSDYYMEVIGDSITAGNSSLVLSGDDNATARYSDGTRTYAYLTAENLGADCSIQAISGSVYSTMLSHYDYVSKTRNNTLTYSYDRKPNVVVINLGTNDQTQTVNYYYNNANSFISKIRNGYNDQTIPIVFYHTCMQADGVRANLTAAIKQLGGEDNNLYSLGGLRSGTHPRMATHKSMANRLTKLLIEEDIMPLSALQDNATIKLSNDTGASTIAYDSSPLSFTSDGTTSRIGTVSSATLKNNIKNTKGIKFDLNYTGTIDKNLYISASDSNGKFAFDAQEGTDNTVVLQWEYLPSSLNATYLHIVNESLISSVAFEFGTDDYSCEISNLEYIRFKYTMSENPACTYTMPTQEPEVYGNTEGYTQTTTTTTTAPTTIAGMQTFEAYNCSPTISGGSIGVYSQTDTGHEGKVSNYVASSVGNYVQYVIPNVESGTYKLSVLSRGYNTRGIFDASINGGDATSIDFNTATAAIAFKTHELGTFTQTSTGNATIKFTATKAGSMYIQYFYLYSVDDSSTGATSATSAATSSTSATTVTSSSTVGISSTTATSSATTQPTTNTPSQPGKAVLYNMDENSRPEAYGVTDRAQHSSIVDSGETDYGNVIKVMRKITQDTQDQSFYFKLPDNVYTAYGTPLSLSFDARTDSGNIYWGNKVYFDTKGTTTESAFATRINTFNKFDSTWTTYSIDLTTGAGLTAVNDNKLYYNMKNVWSGLNTCGYFYVDNITLNYEPAVTQYDVSIDGSVTKVDEGSSFELPTSTDSDFVAYSNGTSLFDEGDSVTVNENMTFTTLNLNLTMSKGAAMRYNSPTGMRFYTNIDEANLDIIKNTGATVNLGTIISPEDIIGTQDFTKDMTGKYSDVPFISSNWYTEETFTGMVGSLATIKEVNVNRKFVGRGYATISLGDFNKTVYADFNESNIDNNSRSICWIARQVKQSTEYTDLIDSRKQIIDYYDNLYLA